MATSYGFFNSISGDRVYNADDVNTFLEGLVSPWGIYANVDDMLQVTAGPELSVNVGSGKASINHHWFRSTATENYALSAAHQILNRYDVVALRLDYTERSVGIVIIEGTPASTPSIPNVIRNDSYFDLRLANVYIPAGATQVLQSNINDRRYNKQSCGFVAGLIEQLDLTAFGAQYNAWMREQTAAFESWFATLTSQLIVNTYIESYEKRVTGTSAQLQNIPLDMTDYVYEDTDILFVTLNGLARVEGTHFEVITTGATPSIRFTFTGSSSLQNEVSIRAIKSKIGDPIPTASITQVTTSAGNDNPIPITITVEEITE